MVAALFLLATPYIIKTQSVPLLFLALGIAWLILGRVDASDTRLREAVGSLADWLRQLAQGRDDRPVVSERSPKSSGSENTFEIGRAHV